MNGRYAVIRIERHCGNVENAIHFCIDDKLKDHLLFGNY